MENFTQETLTDVKIAREHFINRVEVLDKVKSLILIPEMECMTIRQVAEYYEVDIKVIKWQYNSNSDEFISDGSCLKTPVDFKKILNDSKTTFKNLE